MGRSNGKVRLILCSGLLGVALATSGVAAASGADAPDDDVAAADAHAIEFRQTFGFRSDADHVRAAREDTENYSSDVFGVPLSEAEHAELFRRGEIQAAMDAAIAEARSVDTFAGAYLDQQRGGRPVFMFTDSQPARAEQLAIHFPEGADVQVTRAARSERDIAALRARVKADWDELASQGIEVVQLGAPVHTNTILIGVKGLTDAEAAVLRDRYGEHITVEPGEIA